MRSLIDKKIDLFLKKSERPLLAAIVWDNGETFEASYGKEKKLPIDVFEIGSNGKVFTTTLLAILLRDKIVNLNDTVEKFKPNLSFAKAVTLEQLATHTSGLPAYPYKWYTLYRRGVINSVLDFNAQQYETYLSGIKEPSKPKAPEYSNLGMAMLGNILAECLDLTYEQAVKELILEPLGMLETHTSVKKYDEARVAKGHSANGKPAPHFAWERMEPAGVWFSTPRDIMIFLKAHLGYSGDDWKDVLKLTTQPVSDDSNNKIFGLGWVVEENEQMGRISYHTGGTFGQHSVIACALEKDIAIALFSNRRERLWHNFFASHRIDELATSILHSLDEINASQINNT